MNQFNRKRALTVAASVAIGALMPGRARGQTATIRLGQNAADTFGEGYYAADRGTFAAAGLDVQISTFANGAAQAEACAGGAIDVGLGEATELANAISRGLPFAVFASGSLYDSAAPTTQFCVAASSPYHTPKDLEGATVAVPALTSLSSMAVRAWLAKGGVDLTKMHFIELPLSAMSAAIGRGTIAGAHIAEPYLSAAGDTVRRLSSPYDSVAKKFVISDWFATRPWLMSNPAIVKRLTDVIYDTARWANAHHDDSAPILAKYTKIDIDVIRKMRRVSYATSFQPLLMQPVLDTAFAYGGLSRHIDASELIVPPKA